MSDRIAVNSNVNEQQVVIERSGHVLELHLNRPQQRNAVNQSVAQLIAAGLDELDEDDDLRVGIIYGRGGTFCAGMDLKSFAAGESTSVPERGFAGIAETPPRKPLIAAVEGYALGGGLEIALACDIVVAAEDAVLGLPEVTRGLVAGGGGLLRLHRHLPSQIAMDLALTGRHMSAVEAARWGLVARLCRPGAALERARELAAEIVGNAPLAVAASKEILHESPVWPLAEQFSRQRILTKRVRGSVDAQEGTAAFTQRRRPKWVGR